MSQRSPDVQIEQRASVQVFEGPDRPLRSDWLPLPSELGRGQVLARIRLATICTSDLHTVDGRRREPVPSILGHEAVGEVVALGAGRDDLEIGDRITWSIADSCGHCPACVAYGLPQKCESLFKYGHATIHDGFGLNGCYASHIVLRRGTHVVKAPVGVPDSGVAPINCSLATMVNVVSQLPDWVRSVAVQGAGILGLYGCALLRERGIGHVFCLDMDPQRVAMAARFGVTAVNVQMPDSDALEAAAGGVDAVIEVTGSGAAVRQGVRLLRPGGLYVLAGLVHPNSALEFTGEELIRKCLTVTGVHNYAPKHLDEAVEFIGSTWGRYPYEDLVSRPFNLAELPAALHVARRGNWHRVAVRPT
jgi:putative phosphonate catabolism associated alcohol dehydrogenase